MEEAGSSQENICFCMYVLCDVNKFWLDVAMSKFGGSNLILLLLVKQTVGGTSGKLKYLWCTIKTIQATCVGFLQPALLLWWVP